MIWLGERAVLATLGVATMYTCDVRTYRASELEWALPAGAPILINGGGNFGDLWPTAQVFRERIISNHPRRPIVQMPQTAFFRSAESQRVSRATFARHRDFQIMVRDRPSIGRLKGFTDDANITLVPDAAFGLGNLATRREPDDYIGTVKILARRDHEQLHSELADVSKVPVCDWRLGPLDSAGWNGRKWFSYLLRLALPARVGALPSTQAVFRGLYDRQANKLTSSARGYLEPAHRVVTDRLHAHILCVLLGIDHLVMDNDYGKISEFYNEWTWKCPGAGWADDAATALAWLKR